MKRTSLGILLCLLSQCWFACAFAAAPRETDVRVPDVLAAFNALTHHGEWLGFRLRPTDSFLPGPGESTEDPTGKTHYQGIQRWQAPGLGTPFMLVTRAGVKSDDRAELLIVRMGSREPFGERLRSNRLMKNGIANVTVPPPNDGVVTNWTFHGWHHAGSIQLVGDILAVPLEDPHSARHSETGKVVFLDMRDPLDPKQRSYTLDISGHTAGVVGMTKLQDGYFLLVLAWGSNEKLEFYRSTRRSFFEAGFEFRKHDEWDKDELVGGTWRSGTPACYQSLSLVSQSDGRVFMIGARNTSQGSPILNGDDVMAAFEILGHQGGTPATNVQVVARAGEDHKYCSSPGSVSNPVRGSTAGLNANFLASSGTYVSPSGELLFYATEHWPDGPGHTVRMAEFRHQFMGRAGNPLPAKIANAGGTYEVGEGATVLLDGSNSRPPILKPWIELFEHDDFEGRSVVMDWPDRDRDSYEDFRDDLEDFNDKTSSARWWAPAGWIIQLHNQNDLGTEETIFPLPCTGGVQAIADLGSFDNDTTSVQFIAPNGHTIDSPLTYSWTPINPQADAGHLLSQTGAQVTFQAVDGPNSFNVRLDVGPSPIASEITRIEITNVPPAFAGITITSPASQTGRVDLVVNFTDPGATDLHDLRIQWGDGAMSNPISGTPVRSFTNSHFYSNSDPLTSNRLTFTISLRLRDLDGGEVNTNRNVTVTFYDPASTADGDADGLPDTWEDFYFGNRTNVGSADSDGDGRTNREEYFAGTDPMDATDVLWLNIRPAGTNNALSFFARQTEGAGYGNARRYYTIECVTNLTSPSWRVVGALNNVPGANAMIDLLQPRGSDAMRVYRVRAALSVIPVVAGLEHWWRGENNGNDSIGSHHRTFGSPDYTNGFIGRAFSFNGINDDVGLPPGPQINGSWTASFWVYRQDALGQSAGLLMDDEYALKAEQVGTPRRVGFTRFGSLFGTDQNYSFNYTMPAQTWTHVVFVSSPGSTRLFANGVLQGTINATIPLPLKTLGGGQNHRFRGLLDEVGVYDRALATNEVQLLYEIESGR